MNANSIINQQVKQSKIYLVLMGDSIPSRQFNFENFDSDDEAAARQ